MKLDEVECLTTTGVLATLKTVGVGGVPGMTPVCNGGWLTSTIGGTWGCGRTCAKEQRVIRRLCLICVHVHVRVRVHHQFRLRNLDHRRLRKRGRLGENGLCRNLPAQMMSESIGKGGTREIGNGKGTYGWCRHKSWSRKFDEITEKSHSGRVLGGSRAWSRLYR